MIQIRHSLLLLTASFLLNTPTFAVSVDFASGEAHIKKNGKKVLLQKGTQIPKGTIIRTGEKALVILKLNKDSRIKVGENSRFQINDTQINKKNQITKGNFNLISGNVFSKVKNLAKGAKFKIRTKSAVMGVRGTQFFTAYGKKNDVWMCVNKGSVDVQSLKTKKTQKVKEGEGVLVSQKKGITPPKKYSWTNNLNWNMDPEEGSVINKVSMDSAYGDPLDQDYD